MAVTLDSILNQKPDWLSVNDYVVGSTDPANDDTTVDSDGNIITLPEGASNRVTGQLWGHIKNLITVLEVEHNADGTHNYSNMGITLSDLTDVDDALNPTEYQDILSYDLDTEQWIVKDGNTNLLPSTIDGGNYDSTLNTSLDGGSTNLQTTTVADGGLLNEPYSTGNIIDCGIIQ